MHLPRRSPPFRRQCCARDGTEPVLRPRRYGPVHERDETQSKSAARKRETTDLVEKTVEIDMNGVASRAIEKDVLAVTVTES